LFALKVFLFAAPIVEVHRLGKWLSAASILTMIKAHGVRSLTLDIDDEYPSARRSIIPGDSDWSFCADELSPGNSKKKCSLRADKDLPNPYAFGNNHIFVNAERQLVSLPPFQRSTVLNDLAHTRAKLLAKQQCLEPQCKMRLKWLFGCKVAAENIACGPDLCTIHGRCMNEFPGHKRNILSQRFNEMGMGTAMGADGNLYFVQYFRKNAELVNT
jgi:hypothetical protein